ncbi:hypothetical protein [Nonomuraea sp. NPDC049480]|uniref:hypothetical protein n=1 Tax=Nonomuraea sp. NPDC049480 TaxID=3364353 RepID=UPI0037A7469A
MFKRLLIAAALAASTLVVSGSITQPATAGTGAPCVTTAGPSVLSQSARCRWRHGCKYCKKHGEWRRVWCKWWDDDNGWH